MKLFLMNRASAQFIAAFTVLMMVMSMLPVQAIAQETPPRESAEAEVQPAVDTAEAETLDTKQEELFVFASNANANNEPKIKICHANNFGYDNGKKEVDEDSITKLSGHGDHDDGGYNDEGDIIPPFDVDGNAFAYSKNWVEPFISIWGNDCEIEGSITVTKVVEGNDAVDANDFTYEVTLGNDTEEVKSGKGESFGVGIYSVSETPKMGTPTGYTAAFSGDCTAQGVIDLGVAENATCTITNTYTPDIPDDDTATIIASKIVCTDEDDLPNWGNGGPDISSTTAQDWVADHDSCEFEPNWKFEWTNAATADPRQDITTGSAGADWFAFDTQTNAQGVATVELDATEIDGDSYVWVRELLKPGYIPFTWADNDDNSNPESAEMYCATDVLNYDNWERVDGITVGETYHCVAWNVPEDDTDMCTVTIVSDTDDQVENTGNDAELVTFFHEAWDAVINGASWIWAMDPIAETELETNETFSKSFVWNGGTVDSAILTIAADNSYRAEINGTLAAQDATEINYATSTVHDVTGLIATGTNEIVVDVKNWAQVGGTAETNPGGLLYKLVITGEGDDCDGGGYSQGSYGGGYSQGSYGGGEPQTGVLLVRKIVVGTTTDESNFSFDIDKIGTVVGDLNNTAFESDGTNAFDFTTGVFTITEDAAAGYTTTYSNSFNGDADCEMLLVTPNATTTCTITNTLQGGGGYSQGSYGGGYSQGSYGGGEPQTGVLQVIKIVNGSQVDESNFSFDIDKIGTVVGDIADAAFESDGSNAYDFTTGVFTVTENAADDYITSYSNSFNADADCELLLVTPNATTTCTITNTFDGDGGPGYSQGSYGGGYSQGSYGGGGGYSQGSYGGGGGNGTRIELRDSNGRNNDDNDEDEDDAPQGQVLGEQTSILPAGAPNTGKGGASPVYPLSSIMMACALMFSMLLMARQMKM